MMRLIGSRRQSDLAAAIEHRNYRSNGARAIGVGLGLAIRKEIVAAHGGRVGVRPWTPAGSVFFFTLPAAPLAVDQADNSPDPALPVLFAGRP